MPTLQDYFITGHDADSGITDTIWVAQTFTTQASYDITSVKLSIKRTEPGNDTGDFTVSIRETDGSGHPTGGDLAVGIIDGNGVDGNNREWVEITFDSSYTLSDATKYAIVTRTENSDSMSWGRRNSDVYDGGNYEKSTDSGVEASWSTLSGYDHLFETWGNTIDPNVYISGSSVAISGADGNLFLTIIEMSGSSAGISGADGNLLLLFAFLSGSSAGQSSASGNLTITFISLSGSSAGQSGADGDIFVLVPLSGSSGAVCSPTAKLAIVYYTEWINDRPDYYDPDSVWDEETKSWIANDARSGGRYNNRMVVMNDQGEIYFGDM